MSDGLLKPEKDFSKEADKLIPEAEQLAKACTHHTCLYLHIWPMLTFTDITAAVEKLTVFEKQARQASDLASTSRTLIAITTICKDAGNWSLLNDQVLVLSKKHGQLKQAITKMVQTVMGFLDSTPNLETKLSVIETLRTVTEGKIFVEVERARVTRVLSDIKKQQGDLKAAQETLCELQVETFGSMNRREKTEFILAQVALCIENGDWAQAGILSRKISTKYLSRKPKKTPEQLEKELKDREEKIKKGEEVPDEAPDDTTDLKLRYYEQQILLAKHDDKYLDVCKHYRQVLDTEAVEEDPSKLQPVLQRIIYFVILAPHDNEQHDLLHRIYRDARNTQIPTDAQLLKLFTVHELMRWPEVAKLFGPHLCGTDVFDNQPPNPAAGSTTSADEAGKAHQRWQDLRKRVIEHNVRVVAKYYTRIGMRRLTQLLDLTEDETEKYISELVCSKTVYARIDRPARVVSFAQPRDVDDVLNEWSSNMKSLLGLLERVDHLITKEEMMARIQPGAGAGGADGSAGGAKGGKEKKGKKKAAA
ncbi:proteasome regulatory particle subunit [Diatrype stigma]|uniref:Proteasome regulatory particle subunit n=1 Tax=Diatrype stigma TaxID=117547 RepID=A0AAN9URG4_9PEZI